MTEPKKIIPSRPKIISFEASARIQGLLGRELISNDHVALAEIVRNAYDAGAKKIKITFYQQEPQKFVISDDGTGMSEKEFKEVWMTPGYSQKANFSENNGRAILGEKGIGRFAVDKIASKLRIITKKKTDDKAISVDFDWSKFEDQKRKLKDIKISLHKVHDQEIMSQGQGTRLELVSLRKIWEKKDWLELRNELKRLISPSTRSKNFQIIADASGWESGTVLSDFDRKGAYEYSFTINNEGNIIWSLSRPSNVLNQLRALGEKVPAVLSGTDSVENNFGFVTGKFFYFERPPQIKKQGFNSGVGIYRDGFRVEPYGRPNDDWLEVKALKSVNQGNAPINPSRLFGFVEISRVNNSKLRDLTNREGIQESVELKSFKQKIIERFLHFAGFVSDDKDKMPTSPTIVGQRASDSRSTRAQALGEMADQMAHQLRQPMSHISISVGNLEDYIVNKIGDDPFLKNQTKRIFKNIERLNQEIHGLTKLAQNLKQPITEINLENLLNDLFDIHKPNFDAQNIDLKLQLDISPNAMFSESVLRFVLSNYLENAIKICKKSEKINSHGVILGLSRGKAKKIRIYVKDSGDGVAENQKDFLFNTTVDESEDGSGKGLYYCKVMVEQFKGVVGFDSTAEGSLFYIEI